MNELVSICVPAYNGEVYLEECLDSIIYQTYKSLEILVIDDLSTDGTVDLIKSYQQKDDRIKLKVNKANLGLVGNWNACIAEAAGSWIKLHFQDDLMLPHTIEKMMGLAYEHQVDVVLSDRFYLFEKGVDTSFYNSLFRLSDHFSEDFVFGKDDFINLILEQEIKTNFIGEPILGLFHKRVFDSVGYYDRLFKQICDFEFWLRVGLSQSVCYTPERLHTFRVHAESEGAKNARKLGINPSHIDRLHLSFKMNRDQHYKELIEQVGSAFAQNMTKYYFKKYADLYGTQMLLKSIDSQYIKDALGYTSVLHRFFHTLRRQINY